MKPIIVILVISFIFFSAKDKKDLTRVKTYDDFIVKVVDGDTAHGEKGRYRLAGLQTPERKEKDFWKAKAKLQTLVLRKKVKVIDLKARTWGRKVVILLLEDKTCVNAVMRRKYKDTKYDSLLTKLQLKELRKCGWK